MTVTKFVEGQGLHERALMTPEFLMSFMDTVARLYKNAEDKKALRRHLTDLTTNLMSEPPDQRCAQDMQQNIVEAREGLLALKYRADL